MADKTAFDYVNEIWSIANYVRDVIRPADYNKLILPFAVLRRFECALEPTRAAVSRQAAKGVWDDDDPKYCALSGHCFYNVTSFTLSNLGASKTCDALMAYISGFSANAREVLQRFEMRQTCEKLDEKGMLYEVCTRFAGFDLGPQGGLRPHDDRHLRAPHPAIRRGDLAGRRGLHDAEGRGEARHGAPVRE